MDLLLIFRVSHCTNYIEVSFVFGWTFLDDAENIPLIKIGDIQLHVSIKYFSGILVWENTGEIVLLRPS